MDWSNKDPKNASVYRQMGMAALDAQLKSINIMRASLDEVPDLADAVKPTRPEGAPEVKKDE